MLKKQKSKRTINTGFSSVKSSHYSYLTSDPPPQRQAVKAGTEEVGRSAPAAPLPVSGGPRHAAHHPHVTLPGLARQPRQLHAGNVVDGHVAVVLGDRDHPAAADRHLVHLQDEGTG
jgi:hypothetical protein